MTLGDDLTQSSPGTSDTCLQCGRELHDRGDFLECERCGHLEYA